MNLEAKPTQNPFEESNKPREYWLVECADRDAGPFSSFEAAQQYAASRNQKIIHMREVMDEAEKKP